MKLSMQSWEKFSSEKEMLLVIFFISLRNDLEKAIINASLETKINPSNHNFNLQGK